jgi:Arc/MetJ-type ribon-helix-helix transcriptional regulator
LANSIVSIRLPKPLIEELNRLKEKEHFLDVSELIRSVVRKKWLEHSEPEAFQVKKLREEVTGLMKDRKKKFEDQELIEEFERLKQMIREKEGGRN